MKRARQLLVASLVLYSASSNAALQDIVRTQRKPKREYMPHS